MSKNASNYKSKPEFSNRSADPNVMTSTMFSLVWRHWYAAIKMTALYLLYIIMTSSLEIPVWFEWIISIILLVGWVYFDYMDIYRRAMRDANLVKFNYLQYDEKRGLKSGLYAQIPGLIVVFLMCILSLGSGTWSDLFRVLWIVLYSPFVTAIGAVQSLISANIWGYAPFYLIPMLFQPVIGYLAYKNGYNNIGIFYKLIYRTRDKDKRLR